LNGVVIDVNKPRSAYVLTGDIGVIVNRRRCKSNFASIGAVFFEDRIEVPFDSEERAFEYKRDFQYKQILEILDKFGIPKPELTASGEEFVHDIEEEESKFKAFSQKAADIRNNKHAEGDFKSFTESITQKLGRSLYPLQLLSAYHLAFAQNACNFSVPGAGKTTIVYAAYAHLNSLDYDDPKHINKLLIISPPSAFAPWKDEYAACFHKQPTIKLLAGRESTIENRRMHYNSKGTEITLTSYQSAASSPDDVKNITSFLRNPANKVMVVLDEAHRIKNTSEEAIWSNAVLSIAKYAKSRVVLTGTPIPNGYQDLYNLYKFIWPGREIITYPISYLEDISDNYHTPSAKQAVEGLTEQISPFFIRIKKSDLGLPSPIENKPIEVSMTRTQKMIYEHIEKGYISYIERSLGLSFASQLRKAKTMRLMQAAANPSLLQKPLSEYDFDGAPVNDVYVDDNEIMQLISGYDSTVETPSKFKKTLDLIQKISAADGPAGKAIVWTMFVQNIRDLQIFLSANSIKSEILYGAVPLQDRERIIGDFHKPECAYKVIIANPVVVGESISLHKACHNAIYIDKNFNAATYIQSKDRIHRYGLSENDRINYYHIVSENSVDQVIHDRVQEKEARMLEIIEQDIPLLDLDMTAFDDDEDDIRAIIRAYYAGKSSEKQ